LQLVTQSSNHKHFHCFFAILICLFFLNPIIFSLSTSSSSNRLYPYTPPTLQLGCTYSRNPFLSFLFSFFLFFTG
jgi:hypothetical protein